MLAPTQDRTISLIMEKDYTGRTQAGKSFVGATKNAGNDLVRRYIPGQGRNSLSFNGKTLGDSLSSFIDLKGANSISITHSADIGQEQGLFTSFLQPWFVKSVQIEINGSTYLGAYPLLSNKDRDGERMIRALYQTLNDFSGRMGPAGDKERIVLILRGAPKGANRFVGYINNFNLRESVDNAYLMEYTLSFMGKRMDGASISSGTNAGNTSLKG